MTHKSIIALIPARAGSVRIPEKNIKSLAGRPLITYTIAAAKQSGIFKKICVSTDSGYILELAFGFGVGSLLRPDAFSTSDSPDIEWVHHALVTSRRYEDFDFDYFAILRPTSPFRTAATIQRAWAEFERSDMDCLRAVQAVSCNPYKCWTMSNGELTPLLPVHDVPPWHSRPTQTLPKVYQQNASLEMAKCSLVRDRLYPSICSGRVYGFLNPEPEGFDLNTPEDWAYAEAQIRDGEWTLPPL